MKRNKSKSCSMRSLTAVTSGIKEVPPARRTVQFWDSPTGRAIRMNHSVLHLPERIMSGNLVASQKWCIMCVSYKRIRSEEGSAASLRAASSRKTRHECCVCSSGLCSTPPHGFQVSCFELFHYSNSIADAKADRKLAEDKILRAKGVV